MAVQKVFHGEGVISIAEFVNSLEQVLVGCVFLVCGRKWGLFYSKEDL